MLLDALVLHKKATPALASIAEALVNLFAGAPTFPIANDDSDRNGEIVISRSLAIVAAQSVLDVAESLLIT